jgi:hypothetical protein
LVQGRGQPSTRQGADSKPLQLHRFIDWSNEIVADKIVTDSKPLQLHSLAHLVEIILTEQWDVFRLDHKITCEAQGGYMPVVCPVGVCDT